MMPIRSTMPIRALRPGLAKKASTICLYSTTATSAHSTRNTSMRTRKIRGEDNLFSSISMAERGEEPEGILISVTGNRFHASLWHSGGWKKAAIAHFHGATMVVRTETSQGPGGIEPRGPAWGVLASLIIACGDDAFYLKILLIMPVMPSTLLGLGKGPHHLGRDVRMHAEVARAARTLCEQGRA